MDKRRVWVCIEFRQRKGRRRYKRGCVVAWLSNLHILSYFLSLSLLGDSIQSPIISAFTIYVSCLSSLTIMFSVPSQFIYKQTFTPFFGLLLWKFPHMPKQIYCLSPIPNFGTFLKSLSLPSSKLLLIIK